MAVALIIATLAAVASAVPMLEHHSLLMASMPSPAMNLPLPNTLMALMAAMVTSGDLTDNGPRTGGYSGKKVSWNRRGGGLSGLKQETRTCVSMTVSGWKRSENVEIFDMAPRTINILIYWLYVINMHFAEGDSQKLSGQRRFLHHQIWEEISQVLPCSQDSSDFN